MGSVRDLYTTGDNDPEIGPEQYYRHYLYCDACGSFELDPWTGRGDLEKIERKRHGLGGLLLRIGLLVARQFVGSNREFLGLRCRRCEATYAYGTPFFTDLDANPRHLTVADVPRPLGSSPFERGASVESVAV